MNGTQQFVNDTKSLAKSDLGPDPRVHDLAARVLHGGNDDLGLYVVARPLLELAATRHQEQQLEAARVQNEVRRQERQLRRLARSKRLWGQLTIRGMLSLSYIFVSVLTTIWAYRIEFTPDTLLALARPTAIACGVSIAVACVIDWFCDDTSGPYRYPLAALGVVAGLLELVKLWLGVSGDPTAMPWGIGIGWAVGTVLNYCANRLAADVEADAMRASIIRAAGWRRIPVVIGLLTGLSAAFFPLFTGDISTLTEDAIAFSEVVSFLHYDLGIGNSPEAIITLAFFAYLLHIAAPDAARVSKEFAIAATIAAPLLSIIVWLAYTPNFVTLFIAWLVHIFG